MVSIFFSVLLSVYLGYGLSILIASCLSGSSPKTFAELMQVVGIYPLLILLGKKEEIFSVLMTILFFSLPIIFAILCAKFFELFT